MTANRKTGKRTEPRDEYDDFLDLVEGTADDRPREKTKTARTTSAKGSEAKTARASTSGKGSETKTAKSTSAKGSETKTARTSTLAKGSDTKPARTTSVKGSEAKPARSTSNKGSEAKPAKTTSNKGSEAKPAKTTSVKGSETKTAKASTLDKGSGTKATPAQRSRAARLGTSASRQSRATGERKSPTRSKSGSSGRGRSARAEELDPYDEFLAATRPPMPPRRKPKGPSGATIALLAAILCVCGLGFWQQNRYWSFVSMRAEVERSTFYAGTRVEGVDVSMMTLQQALDYWERNVEPAYADRTVTLSDGTSYTARQLGYASDYAEVLTNAFNAGRTGSLARRYAAVTSRKQQPVEYTVNRSPYSEEGVSRCAEAVAAQIDEPAQDAAIQSFDESTYTFVFSEAREGRRVDVEALKRDIAQALDSGGGAVELKVETVQPRTRAEDVAGQYGMIASAVTNASSSSKNRLSNIRLALELINGTTLAPGETFSFNDTVGRRTTDRGFKVATAYNSGEVTEEVGGGICQVSTTLFNAAVKADLEIVERHNHSLTVAYVDKGKDAAVNWNSQDLRFKNDTDENIYIYCYLTDDKRVRVGVFGRLLPNGESITVEGVTTGTIDYDTVYELNFDLEPGQTQVVKEGRTGYTASAYKIRWDAQGNQISRELLCTSRYRAVDRVVQHGP